MDIIASHRIGMVEQYRLEASGLAGRPRDSVQRAIVLHHLYEHSGGEHHYALLSAEAALALPLALDRMAKQAKRARWRLGRERSKVLHERVIRFRASMLELDRARCEALWLGLRLSDTLRGETDPAAIAVGDSAEARFLADQSCAEEQFSIAIEQALAALDWPLRANALHAVLNAVRIPVQRFEIATRRGWSRTERGLTSSRALPRGFADNPAHHYYRLQRSIAERRRRSGEEALDLAADESVRLAA